MRAAKDASQSWVFNKEIQNYKSVESMQLTFSLILFKAPFTRERNRSVPYRSVPKYGTLRGCVHTGTLQIALFRSKTRNDKKGYERWNDKKSDTLVSSEMTFRNPSPLWTCALQIFLFILVRKLQNGTCEQGVRSLCVWLAGFNNFIFNYRFAFRCCLRTSLH